MCSSIFPACKFCILKAKDRVAICIGICHIFLNNYDDDLHFFLIHIFILSWVPPSKLIEIPHGRAEVCKIIVNRNIGIIFLSFRRASTDSIGDSLCLIKYALLYYRSGS